MATKKKTWTEKLHNSKDLPMVDVINDKMSKRWGEGTFVIPAPIEVDEIMKTVPEGKVITSDIVRRKLAHKHGTTIACPLTTGIFTWIAAHAAEEALSERKSNITPYWRTLKAKGELNAKFPGGIKNQMELLEQEGHVISKRGKEYFVQDFENRLVE